MNKTEEVRKRDIEPGDLVIVYGSLRAGMGNNRLLTGLDLQKKEEVSGFKMYSMGAFPFITHGSEEDKITGEIYKVDSSSRATSLDRLEGYPSFYDREQISTSLGDAWIYFIDEKNTSNFSEVEDGDWVSYRTNQD